jgi:ribose-phosphate pyrophosphokinase
LENLEKLIGCDRALVNHHTFPDGETYVQIQGDLKKEIQGREVIIFDSLNEPNSKILPLIFLAETAKDLGAKRVGLVCPYLSYMRQDKRFLPGEGITSTYFAKLVSCSFDWLVTVDPHLHRHASLDEIYSIPSTVVHAGSAIAEWVAQNVEKPFFIGPDAESVQWVSSIANLVGAPFVILEKTRRGDQDVSVTFPTLSAYLDHTPILVDDIISTARTMIQTVYHVNEHHMKQPLCIGVHGIFAHEAYVSLLQAGVSKVVTCNTIAHPTNEIDLLPDLSKAILSMVTA